MPGFPRVGFPRGTSGVLTPTDFTASGTPHAKGGYQEIISAASLTRDVCGILIATDTNIGNSAGTNTSMLLDIAVGAGGSEVDRVANIPVGYRTLDEPIHLPIWIPAGTRIAGRVQAVVASDIFDPRVILLYGARAGGFRGYESADTIGVNTATSAPTTGDLTDNAWDQAIASTARSYRALSLFCCGQGTGMTNGDTTVDIGVGAGGSEQVLGSWSISTTSGELVDRHMGPAWIECDIPAGARLAIRKNGTLDLSGALIGWA